jgi:hypothetical protein
MVPEADQVVGALGSGDPAVPSVIPDDPVWVNITARKTATSSCHQERPSRKNAVHQAASRSRCPHPAGSPPIRTLQLATLENHQQNQKNIASFQLPV